MTHLTDTYIAPNSGPYSTRQAHHYLKNPQHYVVPLGRHARDPKLGYGVFFFLHQDRQKMAHSLYWEPGFTGFT